MNNEVNNNEVNNVTPPVDQNPTPVENVTPVEPVPTTEVPVAETTPEVAPVQTESAPVEAAPVESAPAEATPAPVAVPAEAPAETPAEPRLVQIKPNIGGGSLTPDNSNGTVVAAKKQSIIPVIVLIVALIGLVISSFWLYNELTHKDNTTNTKLEKLPFSGASASRGTTTTTVAGETETTTTVAGEENGTTTNVVKYPNFIGKTVEEATTWANENGIEIKVESAIAEKFESGTIVRQSGEADTPVALDQPFTITVAI